MTSERQFFVLFLIAAALACACNQQAGLKTERHVFKEGGYSFEVPVDATIEEELDEDGTTYITITWKDEGESAEKNPMKGRLRVIEYPVADMQGDSLVEAAAYLLTSGKEGETREDIEFNGYEAIRLEIPPDPDRTQIKFIDVIFQKEDTIYVLGLIANLDTAPDEAAFVEGWLDTFAWE